MDVGFNQTEAHMSDPTMRDTTLRADAWRDPNEQQTEAADHASPFSTGGDAMDAAKQIDSVQPSGPADAGTASHSDQSPTNDDDAKQVSSLLNGISNDAESYLQAEAAPDVTSAEAPQASSDQSVSATEPAPTAEHVPAQSDEVKAEHQPTPIPGAVDVQALLDTLSQNPSAPSNEANVAPSAEGLAAILSPSHAQAQPPIPGAEASSSLSAPGLGAPPSGLPARPPPQEAPLMNPNYVHSQHIRDYHPHAANPAVQSHARNSSADNTDSGSATFAQSTPGATFQQPTVNTQTYQNGQPPNNGVATPSTQTFPPAQQQYTINGTPVESRREFKINAGETPTSDDMPWTQDIQRKYDYFMEEERRYVNEARWDQFPNGSRLFVGRLDPEHSIHRHLTGSSGNLSSEKVTKRDIFHVFHTYGDLAQISIKQAYGFVQFLRTEDCQRALNEEQGRQIRDKRVRKCFLRSCVTSANSSQTLKSASLKKATTSSNRTTAVDLAPQTTTTADATIEIATDVTADEIEEDTAPATVDRRHHHHAAIESDTMTDTVTGGRDQDRQVTAGTDTVAAVHVAHLRTICHCHAVSLVMCQTYRSSHSTSLSGTSCHGLRRRSQARASVSMC